MSLDDDEHIKTVDLLSQRKADDYVEVKTY